MIRENITYTDIEKTKNGFEEVEKELTIRFLFSVAALRLYEQKIGRKFFKDYETATTVLMKYITDIFKSNKKDINDISDKEKLGLAPMLTDPVINEFVLNVIPCLYIKVGEGKYIQNEETWQECEDSVWIMDLVNIEFFMDIFKEISANQSKKK